MLVISGGGGAGIPSEDEVEDDSSSFVGDEYAGDCGLRGFELCRVATVQRSNPRRHCLTTVH